RVPPSLGGVAADEDDGRGGAAGEEHAGGVDDVGEFHLPAEEVLDEPSAELAFQQRVGGELPREARVFAGGQPEDPLGERHRQRVRARAGVVGGAVVGVLLPVPDGGVGRAGHHHVVAVPAQQVHPPGVVVDVLGGVGEHPSVGGGQVVGGGLGVPAVQQRVAHRDVDGEVGGLVQAACAGLPQDGDEQAEPGDAGRERVLVAAVHRVQGLADELPAVGVGARAGAVPGEEAGE